MRKLILCLMLSGTAFGQSWTLQTPSVNPTYQGEYPQYSAARYNPWQQRQCAYTNNIRTYGIIYSDSVMCYDLPTNLWHEWFFNGQANGTPFLTDTASNPGTGHSGGNMAYDFRRARLYQGVRYADGIGRRGFYSWLDNLDAPATGPWTRHVTATTDRWIGSMISDPIANKLYWFGGIINQSATNTMESWAHGDSAWASVTYANTAPGARSGPAIWFDYSYSDTHAGESRIGIYGGAGTDGVTPLTDLWYFYPLGSASLGLAANSWQQITQTGTGPSLIYGFASDYDPRRNVVWAFKSSTVLGRWNPATSTWTDYTVTGGPATCSTACNMVLDAANDALVLISGGDGNTNANVYTVSLSTVAGAAPYTAGTGSTSATARLVERPLPYPALSTAYTDPLGATVKRVSSSISGTVGTDPADRAAVDYSTIDPMDLGGRYLMLINHRILDATNNYADIGLSWASVFDDATVSWSRTTAGAMIGLSPDGTGHDTLVRKCAILTGPFRFSCTTLADLGTNYLTCGESDNARKVWHSERDQNDHYAVAVCRRRSDSQNVMVVVNLQTGVSGVEMVVPPGPGSPGCGPSLGFGPSVGGVGYLGQHVYINWGVSGTGRYCGLESYDLAQAASPTGAWVSEGQVNYDGAHTDVGVYGGVEYFIALQGGWPGMNVGMSMCAVPDGWSRDGSHSGCHNLIEFSQASEVSAHAYNAGGTPYAVLSNFDLDATVGWRPYNDEVVKVYLDSTPAAPHIERIAHTRTLKEWVSDANSAGVCDPSFTSYFAIPQATQTRDGSKIFFNSTWGPQCKAEAYEIALAPSGGNGGAKKGVKATTGGKVNH